MPARIVRGPPKRWVNYHETVDQQVAKFNVAGQMGDVAEVVERWTPTGPNKLRYEATITDPNTFTRPWKMSMNLYKRITLIVGDGVIEHVFYPVHPPERNASEVIAWVEAASPASTARVPCGSPLS